MMRGWVPGRQPVRNIYRGSCRFTIDRTQFPLNRQDPNQPEARPFAQTAEFGLGPLDPARQQYLWSWGVGGMDGSFEARLQSKPGGYRQFDDGHKPGHNRHRGRATGPRQPLGRKGPPMGVYARIIFPRLCDWVMSDPRMAALRKETLAEVGGEVLEVGFGTGLNLPHYPSGVRRIATVDPNPGMNERARRRVAESGMVVDQRVLGGEKLPFEDGSFDCVVSTWTLCSIPEIGRALAEVYRVLRPGGRFVFLEHGLSDDPTVRRWQRRLNPLQRLVGDGCRLDLDVPALVGSQPFADINVERFLMEKVPRTHGTMYRGVATK